MTDTSDPFNYPILIDKAMRGLVREALSMVAEMGQPPNHHFYITFLTGYPGVALSDPVVAKHGARITIVLQNKYWGLEVFDDRFEVNLSFGGVEERVVVPFDAVVEFVDPPAKFGLQIGVGVVDVSNEAAGAPPPVLDGDASAPEAAPDAGDDTAEGGGKDAGGGDVIALDSFRKK